MSCQRVVDFLQERADDGATAIIAAVLTGDEKESDIVSTWTTSNSGKLAQLLICLDGDIREILK